MSDLFFNASLKKFRFTSERGELTAEQLFDLPLTSKNQFNLNSIAIAVNTELKGLEEESFVGQSDDPRRKTLKDKLEVVKAVIAYKQEIAAAAVNRAALRTKQQQLQAAIEAKRGQVLQEASLEDLEKQLAALS